MKVLHLSNSPVAGAPYFWSRCMNKYSNIESRCFSSIWTYPDGREFPHDLEDWHEAFEIAKAADVILIHNRLPPVMAKKKGLALHKAGLVCHSQPQFVDDELLDLLPIAVIAQYYPRMYQHLSFALLPNLIDLAAFEIPKRKHETPWIGYSPSTMSASCGPGNKGYVETKEILEGLSASMHWQVWIGEPWQKLMDEAKEYDIWIDECVTGGYHRASLQAAAFGQEVVNNADPVTVHYMSEITGTLSHPFTLVPLEDLGSFLQLEKDNIKGVERFGARTRHWMEQYWTPEKLIAHHFVPFLERIASDKA